MSFRGVRSNQWEEWANFYLAVWLGSVPAPHSKELRCALICLENNPPGMKDAQNDGKDPEEDIDEKLQVTPPLEKHRKGWNEDGKDE